MPGNFSILLQGFKDDAHMFGVVTRFFRKALTLEYPSYYTFLIDMSTYTFRKEMVRLDAVQRQLVIGSEMLVKNKYRLFKAKRDKMKKDINRKRMEVGYPPIPFALEPEPGKKDSFGGRGKKRTKRASKNKPKGRQNGDSEPEEDKDPSSKIKPFKRWTIADGGCNFLLQLEDNPVLRSHGGRVTLDIHDAVSFSIKLRPTNECKIVISKLNTMIIYVKKSIEFFVDL